MELYELMRDSGLQTLKTKLKFLAEHLEARHNVDAKELQHSLSVFEAVLKKKWLKCNRNEIRFKKINESWLLTPISFKIFDPVAPCKVGRTKKSFEESTDRSKRIKTKNIRKEVSISQLGFATKLNLRAEGHPAAAKLVNEVVRSPRRAICYQNAFRKKKTLTMKLSLTKMTLV